MLKNALFCKLLKINKLQIWVFQEPSLVLPSVAFGVAK